MGRERIVGGLAGAAAALAACPALAGGPGELYQWTDAHGVVRYTPQLERIPAAQLPHTLVIRRDGPGGAVVSFAFGQAPPLRAAAAPAPPAPPAERYAIELEAQSLSAWVRPLDRLQLLAGRRLYRTRVELDGRSWERLRLGFFPGLDEARAALARVAPQFPGAWIDRADSAERAASRAGAIASDDADPPGAGGEAPGWVLQLAARAVDDDLRGLTRLELLDRHHLYRTVSDEDGETWERLRLGFFPSRESALAVLRELEGSHPDARVARVAPEEALAH